MKTLKQYLTKEGITQTEFCKRTDIDTAMMSRIVNGERFPPVDMALRIEKASGGVVQMEVWAKARANRGSRGQVRGR